MEADADSSPAAALPASQEGAEATVPASQEETKTPASEAPKGDLSSRLKGRGLDLTPLDGTTSQSLDDGVGKSHAPMSETTAEKEKLFTPLASQGAQALEEEVKRREETEKELFNGIVRHIKNWVQECLVDEEKKQKLINNGVMKCRVQARWSEGLHDRLKELVATYGGKLLADGDKEGATRGPAWATAATLKNERWLVGFDLAAFEKFTAAHPETVDPPEESVRNFVSDYIGKVDLTALKIRDLLDALRAKFGTIRRPLIERAKLMASVAIVKLSEESAKKGIKRKDNPVKLNNKRAKLETPKAQISKGEDVLWAEATLAPLGLKENGELVMQPPASLARPILEGLKDFQAMDDFKDLLRKTKIGKIVNGVRRHSNPEVSKLAKDLLLTWKSAVLENNKIAKKPSSGNRPTGKDAGGPSEPTASPPEDNSGVEAAKAATACPAESAAKEVLTNSGDGV